ncbi:hypothetical protein F5X98DRAFT_42914 [Xylaria grammica]|nr:hypothetical protein F5X98DRAFT_42914 [Xylaria grammica]
MYAGVVCACLCVCVCVWAVVFELVDWRDGYARNKPNSLIRGREVRWEPNKGQLRVPRYRNVGGWAGLAKGNVGLKMKTTTETRTYNNRAIPNCD